MDPEFSEQERLEKGICLTLPPNADQPATPGLGAVVATSAYLWPNESVITVGFVPGPYQGTAHQHKKVYDTIKEWEKYANVTFQPAEGADAMVRIAFRVSDKYGGDWSGVGVDILTNLKDFPKGESTMNLETVKDRARMAPWESGTILHEFGHVLGLYHEHQSPARGGKITLKRDAILEAYSKFDVKTIENNILNVYNSDEVSNYSAFDEKSIMLYEMPGSLNEENITLNSNETLSDLDKAYMTINYPRPTPHPDAPAWTFEHALDVAGVDDATKAKLTGLLGQDIKKLRETFNQWNALTRALK